jgi:putative transcriptional regulator
VSRNFAGSLLVAHPNMVDAKLSANRAFVSEHEPKEGALGVIIIRPVDRAVTELVSGPPPPGLADVPVFWVAQLAKTS